MITYALWLTNDGKYNDSCVKRCEAVDNRDNNGIFVAVVVLWHVAAHRNQTTESQWQTEEDLGSRIQPHTRIPQMT